MGDSGIGKAPRVTWWGGSIDVWVVDPVPSEPMQAAVLEAPSWRPYGWANHQVLALGCLHFGPEKVL